MPFTCGGRRTPTLDRENRRGSSLVTAPLASTVEGRKTNESHHRPLPLPLSLSLFLSLSVTLTLTAARVCNAIHVKRCNLQVIIRYFVSFRRRPLLTLSSAEPLQSDVALLLFQRKGVRASFSVQFSCLFSQHRVLFPRASLSLTPVA